MKPFGKFTRVDHVVMVFFVLCPIRSSQAAQAAAAAASQINAKLGLAGSTPTSNTSAPSMNSSIGSSGPHAGLGMVTTENYQVPDRMVGLSKFLGDDFSPFAGIITGVVVINAVLLSHLACL